MARFKPDAVGKTGQIPNEDLRQPADRSIQHVFLDVVSDVGRAINNSATPGRSTTKVLVRKQHC